MFSERPETILPELEAPVQPIEFGAEEPLVSRDLLHDRLGRVVLVDLGRAQGGLCRRALPGGGRGGVPP